MLFDFRRFKLVAIIVMVNVVVFTVSLKTGASTNSQGATATEERINSSLMRAVATAVDAQYQSGLSSVYVEPQNLKSEGIYTLGTAAIKPLPGVHGGPTGMFFIAKKVGESWVVVLQYTLAFDAELANVPTTLIASDARPYIMINSTDLPQTGGGESGLSLPWGTGVTAYLTGGPHHNEGINTRPFSALDFVPDDGIVRAAREGIVSRDCTDYVRIDHGNGYQTGYYHLRDIAVSHGQTVSRGQMIGHISRNVGCGGRADGDHVHFSLRDGANNKIEIHDTHIGGWLVEYSGEQWQGCMLRLRDNYRQCAPSGRIYNEGAIGSGTPPPDEVTVPENGTVDRTGNPAYFYNPPAGSTTNNGATYTHAYDGSVGDNTIKYKPALPRDGCYQVYAYIAWINTGTSDSRNVPYEIQHQNGSTTIRLNINSINIDLGQWRTDRWRHLGGYQFSANAGSVGQFVKVRDDTGESFSSQLIVPFDDIKWVFDQSCTPVPPSPTPLPSPTPIPPTPTVTATRTFTPTVTTTRTFTPTVTATRTFTPTATTTRTFTPTATLTSTFTPTATLTSTFTPTVTLTSTFTPTVTLTSTFTPTVTLTSTFTPTATLTSTFTPTATLTSTFTPTATLTSTFTPTATGTPVPIRPDTIGVYHNGTFYLRHSNTTGAADITVNFGGQPSDLPVVGDWNGDGMDTIGVYRNATGFFILSNSNTTPAANYEVLLGNPGDTPFAGKWTADMIGDGIGVFRPTNGILYAKRQLTSGFSDYFAVFGDPGDVGYAGDWNGDGLDSIGIYRPSNGYFFMTQNSQPSGVTFGDLGFPWDIGTGIPVVGDWNADGITTVGQRTGSFFALHSANATAGSDTVFTFGPTSGRPIAGKWTLGSAPNAGVVINPVNGINFTGGNSDSAD